MYYKLSSQQELYLLRQPETGMGYQVLEASIQGDYTRKKFLALNSEIIIEMDGDEDRLIKKIINEGIYSFKADAHLITLSSVSVLNEDQFRNIVSEVKNANGSGAIDNAVENANGEDIFVRLSAFDNDRRIDKIKKCLLPGSFATTADDYIKCKTTADDPIERYALPNNDKIKFVFKIQPERIDTLQRGIVQPAYGKRGGGREAYFANGTATETFLGQEPY